MSNIQSIFVNGWGCNFFDNSSAMLSSHCIDAIFSLPEFPAKIAGDIPCDLVILSLLHHYAITVMSDSSV